MDAVLCRSSCRFNVVYLDIGTCPASNLTLLFLIHSCSVNSRQREFAIVDSNIIKNFYSLARHDSICMVMRCCLCSFYATLLFMLHLLCSMDCSVLILGSSEPCYSLAYLSILQHYLCNFPLIARKLPSREILECCRKHLQYFG